MFFIVLPLSAACDGSGSALVYLFVFLCRLLDFLVIEIVDYHRRFSKRGTMLIVIPQIRLVLFFCVFPHSLIQRCPVIPALFAVYLVIKTVQLRVLLMDPFDDPCTVVTAQVQILQPYQIALLLCRLDDLNGIGNAGEDRGYETGMTEVFPVSAGNEI